jgi:F420-dependent methylenetetrahydromethanopterin dehydrogenase
MKTPESGRAVRIKNTLHLGEVAISEALMDEIADRDDLEVRASLSPLPFDHSGTLVALS